MAITDFFKRKKDEQREVESKLKEARELEKKMIDAASNKAFDSFKRSEKSFEEIKKARMKKEMLKTCRGSEREQYKKKLEELTGSAKLEELIGSPKVAKEHRKAFKKSKESDRLGGAANLKSVREEYLEKKDKVISNEKTINALEHRIQKAKENLREIAQVRDDIGIDR